MKAPQESLTRFRSLLAQSRDQLTLRFSFFFIPACIVLGTLFTILTLNDRYPPAAGQDLPFKAMASADEAQNPNAIHAALAGQPPWDHNAPLDSAWLLFTPPAQHGLSNAALYVGAPLAKSLSCWDSTSWTPLGRGYHQHASRGALESLKQGFAIQLQASQGSGLLCHIHMVQPGALTVELWEESLLQQSAIRYHRGIGLLEGGLLTMALFIVIIAVTNREWLYVLLAAWLVGNLRLGAYMMGWDTQWLGHAIPLEWMPLLRKFTVAAYFLLTYSLFTRLFQHDPLLQRARRLVGGIQWAGLVLLVAVFALPDPLFLALAWAVCGFSLLSAIYLLVRILMRTRSRVWLWHIVLLAMALCVMASSLLLMVFGRTEFLNTFNSVISLLLPSVVVALAVAERISAESNRRIRDQAELVSNFALTPIGMFTLNAQGAFEHVNPVLEQMLGCSLDGDHPVRWTDYFEPQNWEALDAMTRAGQEVEISVLPDASEPGRPQNFIVRAAVAGSRVEGSLQDITARTETIRQLRLMADNDPLTNVFNRRGIEKALDTSIKALADGQPCSIAYLDLEHFDRINGLFGHTTGDEVLKLVTEHLKQRLLASSQIGHLGADEFILIFPNTRAAEARTMASDLVQSLNATDFQVENRNFQLRSAIGVVEINHNMTAKDAISAASRACRDARKLHEDIIVYQHDSDELLEHTEELRLFNQLEGGSSPRGLYLEMQPIMALHRPLQSMNFEILLRVRDSTGALIPTGKVVGAAEESGTISLIDKWVFSATLEWLDKHAHKLSNSQFVSLNLSGVSLNDSKFVDALFTILNQYEHLVSRLCVEITEGVALQDLERTRLFMRRLQRMGARIALDDFGAGYTSFSYLKTLPADIIKIDGALIRDMGADHTTTAIVRTIVELAHNLDMECIAEWVEDHQTLALLRDMGVDYVQGYVVARAKSPAEILAAKNIADLIADAGTLEFVEHLSH